MPIFIQNRQRTVKLQTAQIKKRLQQLLAVVGCSQHELSIVFANDTLMRRLNRTYRQKDQTTNVLAFPQEPVGPQAAAVPLLGDVVVCLPVAAREAADQGQPVEDRVLYLLLHGILHLLGYDHEGSEAARRRMEARERDLLRFLQGATAVPRQSSHPSQEALHE